MADQPVAKLVRPEVEISADNDEVAAVAGMADELAQLQALHCAMSLVLVRRIVLRVQLIPTTHTSHPDQLSLLPSLGWEISYFSGELLKLTPPDALISARNAPKCVWQL